MCQCQLGQVCSALEFCILAGSASGYLSLALEDELLLNRRYQSSTYSDNDEILEVMHGKGTRSDDDRNPGAPIPPPETGTAYFTGTIGYCAAISAENTAWNSCEAVPMTYSTVEYALCVRV